MGLSTREWVFRQHLSLIRMGCNLKFWIFPMMAAAMPLAALPLVAATPRVLVPGFRLQEFASAPSIVTPVAIAFDHNDQLLAIESHTHQRPDDYVGPSRDRIRRFIDDDQDGRAERVETFYEGTSQTMSLIRGPERWMYVATRRSIMRIRDADADGRAEETDVLIRLDTPGDYPHNGLSGLTFTPDGRLAFGLGENLGEPYRLTGPDGESWRGEGEGGNVFLCDIDGRNIERLATGFWNPFGNCYDPQGRLFTVDNDPDASPPCRLLDVIRGADFGYQFRYGRSGRHPLQAWDAELPGTLPMTAGTGEAPCQIVPYRGRLWVTSWGDYRIEAYTVRTVGASTQAQLEIIVQGDARFRPVGLAIAHDGSLYFSDWVDRSYPVHRQGRIWRLVPDDPDGREATFPERSPGERRADTLRCSSDRDALLAGLLDPDPYIRQAASTGLAGNDWIETVQLSQFEHAEQRLGILMALRWRDPALALKQVNEALEDPSDRVCILGLRLIAETQSVRFRPNVARALEHRQPLGFRLASVALSTLAWLDQASGQESLKSYHGRLAGILMDDESPLALRQLALRALPPGHPALSLTNMRKMLRQDERLRRSIVATLADGETTSAGHLLAELAIARDYATDVRADACAALAAFLPESRKTLEQLLQDPDKQVRIEAERSLRLRGASSDASSEVTIEDLVVDDRPGDADAGQRVFFRAVGARCGACHTHTGRGGSIGPELTTIDRRGDRKWLLENILDPSRDVAPRFATMTVITEDGRTITGQTIAGPGDDSAETFAQSDGSLVTIPHDQIDERHYHTQSIMPADLGKILDRDELRDLLAFLSGQDVSAK